MVNVFFLSHYVDGEGVRRKVGAKKEEKEESYIELSTTKNTKS